MKKKKKREKNRIEWIYLRFFVDYNNVGLNNIINFHKYLMKKIIYNNVQNYLKMFIVLLINVVHASNHTKCVSLSNEKCEILLLIYILMNTVKYYTTIHLRLNQIDALEVVIFLMIYLITYVFQKRRHLNIDAFNMITGISMKQNLKKNMSCKCKFISGIMINADGSVKISYMRLYLESCYMQL